MSYSVKFGTSFLGRTISLDNGVIEFSVSLDVGPRITSFSTLGGLNVMYEDTCDLVNKDCSKVYGKGNKWHIYGGHRLWLSPEDLSTYYPDNEKVCYDLTENGILVYPKKWQIIDIQPQILIEFVADNKLKITHKVKNLGDKRKLCLWALTVMKAGGEMTLKLPTLDTKLLPNRNIVLWQYAKINDPRVLISDDKIIAKSDIREPNPYKIGAYNKDIHAKYVLEENGKKATFIKEAKGIADEIYPDFHCNFECYFSDKIHEIETLSSIREVEKEQDIEHIEFWQIY
jgi:hypothetical protein